MKILFVIVFIGLTAIPSLSQSEREKAKIRGSITSVLTEQAEAWNRGDIESYMRGYWNSDDLVFVSSNVTRGWKPTLERYKKSYDTREKMGTLSFSDLEITVLSRDAAVVLGTWALQRKNDRPGGKFTLIFRKFREGWRIVHDHTS